MRQSDRTTNVLANSKSKKEFDRYPHGESANYKLKFKDESQENDVFLMTSNDGIG